MNAAEFLSEREDFLYVYVVPSSGDARGYDVVVRIDGTYTDKTDALGAAEAIKEWFLDLTDVPVTDRRHWWFGAPWKRDTK